MNFKEKINEAFRNPELTYQLSCSSIYYAFTTGADVAREILEQGHKEPSNPLKEFQNAYNNVLLKIYTLEAENDKLNKELEFYKAVVEVENEAIREETVSREE